MSDVDPLSGRPARSVDERVPDPLARERLDRVVSMLADVSRREAAELVADAIP